MPVTEGGGECLATANHIWIRCIRLEQRWIVSVLLSGMPSVGRVAVETGETRRLIALMKGRADSHFTSSGG